MNYEEFAGLVIENAHPPKKHDKWFRLSKFMEEWNEHCNAKTAKKIHEELEDCLYTLALMGQFVDGDFPKEF